MKTTPDWDAFERNRSMWRMETDKQRLWRKLKFYGLSTAILLAAGFFGFWELHTDAF